MAHHQGMILMSLANYLYDDILQKRFHQNPMIKAGEILLQEKIPLRAIITKEFKEYEDYLPTYKKQQQDVIREYDDIGPVLPSTHIISNGRYAVMLSDRGGGYSKCDDVQITRWREDAVLGNQGSYVVLRKINNNKVWSATYEPINSEGDSYKS